MQTGGAVDVEVAHQPDTSMPVPRDRWANRVTFILAAVASAVGVGNLWRFPSLSFKYGGGAFFVPYLVALFLIGIPILILEFSVGQVYQGGGLKAFGSVNPRFRGLGLAAATAAFVIVLYYSSLLSWGTRYLLESFFVPAGWSFNVGTITQCASTSAADCSSLSVCVLGTSGTCGANFSQRATSFLFNTVLQNDPALRNLSIVWGTVLGLAVIWLMIYGAVFKGVISTGWVVWVTMFVPLLIIIALAIYGTTLPGSAEGIRQYIGVWDLSSLIRQPDIYIAAVGQIFFSLSITGGIMPAYASYNKRNQDIFQDAIFVSIANSCVSLIAGFAVFTVVGYLATLTNNVTATGTVNLAALNLGGPLLVFVAYPVALSTLPVTASWILSALFFLTFVLLGVDSAFSLVEAFGTVIYDSPLISQMRINGERVTRWLFMAIFCIVCFLLCFMYATRIGFTLLDVVDWYINDIAAVLVGCLECVSVSWVYGSDRVAKRVGSKALFISAASWFGGALFGVFFLFVLPVNIVFGIVTGAAIMIGGMIYSVYVTGPFNHSDGSYQSIGTRMYEVLLGPVEEFRKDVNRVTTGEHKMGIPMVWGVLTKYFIPVVLMSLLLRAIGPSGSFGRYGGYNLEMQAVGFFFALVCIIMIVIGLASPEVYDFLYPTDMSEEELYTKPLGKTTAKLSVVS
ncbi:Sodium:neurotransmitter symporter family protein [Cardiosporidium cionae]|uniref:Sodium:neurotransmitter symporter family protein n=1 Tax=Cardiosporidium cionae TaxID=476202 RepID=A0ABQ7J444_9APIC|nr:Sodium:neurotransmitter symporter family protein [Cardiosporidium cionae]|eukprot:KAF8817809.1 Sodium:neurotransmitter symporter family protein [Cardiosporidium cionae]